MKESFLSKLRADIKANWTFRNPKPAFCIVFYRIVTFFSQNEIYVIKFIGYPIRAVYRIVVEWLMGVEIPDVVKSGGGLTLHHGVGLVVNPKVVLGRNVTLKNNTTIGCKMDYQGNCLGSPLIEDNVIVGPNVVIFGEITVGANSIIGAGSVVIKDVPKNSIVAGNPAKVVKTLFTVKDV